MTFKYHLAAFSALTLMTSTALADEIRVLNWQGYGTDQSFAV